MPSSSLYPLIWQIRRSFQQLRAVSEQLLNGVGINPGQRAVLEFLVNESRHPVPQIAKHLTVSRQHIQVLVNQLLELELVTTLDNPVRTRSPIISITPAGKKLFAGIQEKEARLLRLLEKKFTGKEIAAALQSLEKLSAILQSELEQDGPHAGAGNK